MIGGLSGAISMQFRKTLRRARQRRGLSFVEFVGCFIAMVGGVTLGSMYLGIDVKQMAIGVLEQAQVVTPGYFEQGTATAETAPPDDAETAAEFATSESPTDEPVTLPEENSESDAEVVASDAAPEIAQARTEATAEERRRASRAYWNQLTECMKTEARGRVQEVGDPEQWQIYDYLTQRKNGHQQALDSLETLETFGVDERLLNHGEQVATWHKSGAKLFEHAVSLLTDGPGAKISGPFAQSWQSAATQLRMEENLVIERHKGVANYLDREFAEEAPFVPAFQK
jgi:hypothetical protein